MKKLSFSWLCLLFLALAASTGACTKKGSSPGLDQGPQTGACEQLNLARDASWTADFVKSFIQCLSEGKEGSREKFQLTTSVLDKLGRDSLQAALDLFRWEHEGKEVFLGFASSFLDRGVSKDENQRWAQTQKVLEETRPYALMKLMIELKKRELLNPLLDVIQSTDSLLPEGFLETGIRQFLTDEKVRADAEVLIRAFLADADAFEALSLYLTPERKALAPGCKAETLADCPYPEAGALKSSAEHWLDFWTGLEPERRERLALAMGQVLKGTLEQSDQEAHDRSQRLARLATQAVARSHNVFAQGHEALSFILDTPVVSYEPFIQGMNRIKDNPLYLDAFLEKMGSSHLHDMVEDMLWKGGQPIACSQKIPGLGEGTDAATRRDLLRGLLQPNSLCGDKVPVLLAMSQTLGFECPKGVCAINLLGESADATAISPLMSYFLRHMGDKLKTDPWTLFRLGSSRRDVPTEVWGRIQVLGAQAKFQSIPDILNFEASIAQQFSTYLAPDWLELSLSHSLLELSLLEESFTGLFPDRDPVEQWYFSDVDSRMARVVFGLYPHGPADKLQDQLFSISQLQKDWEASHPQTQIAPRELAQLLAPLRSLSAQYRNPLASFKAEAEKINLPWLGSVKSAVTFLKDGAVESSGDSLKLNLLFDESTSGFNMRVRYREQLVLATSSLPTDEAAEFNRWINDEWIPARVAVLPTLAPDAGQIPFELFDRQALSAEEARMLPLFLGQQFVVENQALPQGVRINPLPESNVNPKNQAARAYYGPAALGGGEHPWTSFWLSKNTSIQASHSSLSSILSAIPGDAAAIESTYKSRVTNPLQISQGLLDLSDAEKLSDHDKLLLQLHLMSPIFDVRGKQLFVPAVGFAEYCPQKTGEQWAATACPFGFNDFATYKKFLEERYSRSFCALLSSSGPEVLSSLGLKDTPGQIQSICARYPTSTRWPKAWLQATLKQTLALGKNPKLRPSLRSLPGEIRWLKAQENQSPKQIVKAYLAHAPIIDGLTSAKVLQRNGTHEAFYSTLPGASPMWLLYLSQSIGLRGISESLKRLGDSPVAGSEKPMQDFLSLISRRYDEAKAKQWSTLAFGLGLLTDIAQNPYARETIVRLIGKPYDPYGGILISYTLPQAVKAGILPEFNGQTYAPLRLFLRSDNLFVFHGLADIYDRDSLEWLDHWLKITEQFTSLESMATEVRPLGLWVRSYLGSRGPDSARQLSELLVLRNWDQAVAAATRQYRLLRVSLPDLSNRWHEPYYFQSTMLSRALLESLPRLLALKDRFELDDGDKNLMPEAFLGMIQGPLKHDAKEIAAWLQDDRMGFRSPSFLGAAVKDPQWRLELDAAISGLEQTSREEWKGLRDEWGRLGPQSYNLIDYMANNVVLRSDKAAYQKQGLKSLARLTGDTDRWDDTQKVFDAWLDDRSVLRQWQENGSKE